MVFLSPPNTIRVNNKIIGRAGLNNIIGNGAASLEASYEYINQGCGFGAGFSGMDPALFIGSD